MKADWKWQEGKTTEISQKKENQNLNILQLRNHKISRCRTSTKFWTGKIEFQNRYQGQTAKLKRVLFRKR